MQTLKIIMTTSKPGSEDFRDKGWYTPLKAYTVEMTNALFHIQKGSAIMLPESMTIDEFNGISLFERRQWVYRSNKYAA